MTFKMSDILYSDTRKDDRDISNEFHVVFILSTLAIGGSERKTIGIANAITRRGYKSTIIYLNEPHTLKRDISDKVDVVYINRKGKFGINALKTLINNFNCNDISIVFCINLYPLLYAFIARKLSKIKNVPIVVSTNTTEFVRQKDRLQMLIYAPCMRRIEKILFGCAYQRDLWISKYKLDESRCEYVYNGVDVDYYKQSYFGLEKMRIRSELNIPSESIVIGSVGRFRKEKQYELLISACVELKQRKNYDVHCLLVGGGYEKKYLEKLIIEHQCESYVHLLDIVDDVRSHLAAIDVFVLTSISETFSNAALEAMSMSIPVVLPKVGGCPEMIQPGINGYIYEMGNIQQLVGYLSILIADSQSRVKMGTEARYYVKTMFSYDSMLDKYMRLFKSLNNNHANIY